MHRMGSRAWDSEVLGTGKTDPGEVEEGRRRLRRPGSVVVLVSVLVLGVTQHT
jgi:hypothetical protein